MKIDSEEYKIPPIAPPPVRLSTREIPSINIRTPESPFPSNPIPPPTQIDNLPTRARSKGSLYSPELPEFNPMDPSTMYPPRGRSISIKYPSSPGNVVSTGIQKRSSFYKMWSERDSAESSGVGVGSTIASTPSHSHSILEVPELVLPVDTGGMSNSRNSRRKLSNFNMTFVEGDKDTGEFIWITGMLKEQIQEWGERVSSILHHQISKEVDNMSQTVQLYSDRVLKGRKGKIKVDLATRDIISKLVKTHDIFFADKIPQVVKSCLSDLDQRIRKINKKIRETRISQTTNAPNKEMALKRQEFTPIKEIISASQDESIIFWDKNMVQVSMHKSTDKYIRMIEGMNNQLAVTKSNGEIEIINKEKREVVSNLKRPGAGVIWGLCELASGELVTGSRDKTIRIWNIKDKKCTHILHGHSNYILCVKEHSTGRLLSGGYDGCLRIWNLKNLRCLKTLDHEEAWIWDIQELSGRPNRILSVCQDDQIALKLWEFKTLKTLYNVQPPEDEEYGFSAVSILDVERVLLGGTKGTIKVFNYELNNFERSFHQVHSEWVYQIQIVSHAHALSCSGDRTLKLFNFHTGEVDKVMEGHTQPVCSFVCIFQGDKKAN